MTTQIEQYKEKKYTRHGECNYQECGGACCKCLGVDGWSDPDIELDGTVCVHLENGLCSINENKPESCGLFPNHPDNLIYKRVKNVCGFYFEEINE